MKILGWAPKDVRIPPSAVKDAIPLAGLFLFNSVQFSDYAQLVHVWAKPWVVLIWLYGLGGFVLLFWRGRAPVTVFAAQWVLAMVACSIVRYYAPVVGILIALYAVSVQRDRRLSLLALLASLVPVVLYAVILLKIVGPSGSIPFAVVFALAAGGVWGSGRLTRASNQRMQKVEAERDEAKAAVREQRKTLARELHDIVSHAVTVMVVQAGGAARVAGTDFNQVTQPLFNQVTQALVHIETHGRQAMAELRRLLGVLDGAGLGERGPQPGLVDLPVLLSSLRAAGMLVAVHTEGTARDLDPSVDLTAYRIVQEALTNVLKHAGTDSNPRLQLSWQAQKLYIQVDNHINPTKTHHGRDLPGGRGLLGLRERTHTAGGHLQAGPHRDGYQLTATLPLAEIMLPQNGQLAQ
ncbi:MAG: sensor histidine kinase [Pseudonocardiaceae bacterium]